MSDGRCPHTQIIIPPFLSRKETYTKETNTKRDLTQKVTYTEGNYFDDVHTHYNTLTLQHIATHYNTLQLTVKQCVLVFYNVLQCVVVWKHNHPDRKSVLQCIAVCCSVLQCVEEETYTRFQ